MNETIKLLHKSTDNKSQYIHVPFVDLHGLAKTIRINSLHVKDESYRFGLNTFKALSDVYCLAKYLSQALPYDQLLKHNNTILTFVTATVGLHANSALTLESSCLRLTNIQALSVEASITDLYYNDTSGVLGQDTTCRTT